MVTCLHTAICIDILYFHFVSANEIMFNFSVVQQRAAWFPQNFMQRWTCREPIGSSGHIQVGGRLLWISMVPALGFIWCYICRYAGFQCSMGWRVTGHRNGEDSTLYLLMMVGPADGEITSCILKNIIPELQDHSDLHNLANLTPALWMTEALRVGNLRQYDPDYSRFWYQRV